MPAQAATARNTIQHTVSTTAPFARKSGRTCSRNLLRFKGRVSFRPIVL
jgi:hypothetical protein